MSMASKSQEFWHSWAGSLGYCKKHGWSLYVDFATRIVGGAQPWHHQHYSINVRLDWRGATYLEGKWKILELSSYIMREGSEGRRLLGFVSIRSLLDFLAVCSWALVLMGARWVMAGGNWYIRVLNEKELLTINFWDPVVSCHFFGLLFFLGFWCANWVECLYIDF